MMRVDAGFKRQSARGICPSGFEIARGKNWRGKGKRSEPRERRATLRSRTFARCVRRRAPWYIIREINTLATLYMRVRPAQRSARRSTATSAQCISSYYVLVARNGCARFRGEAIASCPFIIYYKIPCMKFSMKFRLNSLRAHVGFP